MLRIIGILLLAGGLIGLAGGTFQYTRKQDVLEVGPLHIEKKQTESLTIPPLAAGGVAALGLILILAGARKTGR